MYVLPDIRNLIRRGELTTKNNPESLQRVLDCPCSFRDVALVYNENIERIQAMVACDDESIHLYKDAIEMAMDESDSNAILYIGDAKSEEECVYAIAVNHILKLVVCVHQKNSDKKMKP